MIFYPKTYLIPIPMPEASCVPTAGVSSLHSLEAPGIPALSLAGKAHLLSQAEEYLTTPIPHITDAVCPGSPGTIHDYCSNGDYWWPDPDSPDGLPFIRRDGETNPDNFNSHRMLLRRMRTLSSCLAAAWKLTENERYAARAVQILKEFFLDPDTRMAPHLSYAQAIPGICDGRGIGIIDTIHLADIPFAVQALKNSSAMTDDIETGLRLWFSQYLGWMLTSANGIEEMNTDNNHSICFFMQAAVFSLFTDNELIAGFCREHYKKVLIRQMEPDGSFPRELARTKPYNYSIFVVDNLVTICHVLSTPEDDLWDYTDTDGRNIRRAIDFILPYLLDKNAWPYPPDVMHFDAFPARASFMPFAGYRLGIPELIKLYESLPLEPEDEEARRNVAVRQAGLWM